MMVNSLDSAAGFSTFLLPFLAMTTFLLFRLLSSRESTSVHAPPFGSVEEGKYACKR